MANERKTKLTDALVQILCRLLTPATVTLPGLYDLYLRDNLLALAGHGDGHILTVTIALLLAVLTGRSDLCIAGVFCAGKTRSLAVLLIASAVSSMTSLQSSTPRRMSRWKPLLIKSAISAQDWRNLDDSLAVLKKAKEKLTRQRLMYGVMTVPCHCDRTHPYCNRRICYSGDVHAIFQLQPMVVQSLACFHGRKSAIWQLSRNSCTGCHSAACSHSLCRGPSADPWQPLQRQSGSSQPAETAPASARTASVKPPGWLSPAGTISVSGRSAVAWRKPRQWLGHRSSASPRQRISFRRVDKDSSTGTATLTGAPLWSADTQPD